MCSFVAVTLLALALSVWFGEGLTRLSAGSQPGVTLAGRPAGGLFPNEVEELLEELTTDTAREVSTRQAAAGDSSVQEAVWKVDLRGTVRAVMEARPSEDVQFMYEPVVQTPPEPPPVAVYEGRRDRRTVSIAINVDWGTEHLPSMLRILAGKGVKATFFLTGTWTEANPAVAREIAAQGHEIGNHGYEHLHPNALSTQEIDLMIMKNHTLLRTVTGRTARLFAPPYGEYDEEVLARASALGYRLIMWSLDTVDWQKPPPEVIVERVVPRAHNGAIILMHPTAQTLEALPEMISRLRAAGFGFEPVGKLIH